MKNKERLTLIRQLSHEAEFSIPPKMYGESVEVHEATTDLKQCYFQIWKVAHDYILRDPENQKLLGNLSKDLKKTFGKWIDCASAIDKVLTDKLMLYTTAICDLIQDLEIF